MAETMATVYSCEPLGADAEDEDDFGATGFRVLFSYSVAGDRFSGEFFSPRRMAKNQTFTLTYDSEHPERNQYTEAEDEDTRLILKIVIAVIVAIVLLFALVYFFLK